MDKITLVIPTYNSSQYIEEAIENSLLDDFVSEILISDDCSNSEQYNLLKEVIEKKQSNKIKLISTKTNLGGFQNKYYAVNNAINDWIYLLDGDNHMFDDTLKLIRTVENLNPNICYCPEKLILHYDNQLPHEEVTYDFGFEYIGLDEIKILLENNIELVDWFLNTGNYFFNKNNYVKYLQEHFKENFEETFAGDVIAASYYWFKNGGKFKILKGFKYYHRLRNDSYWHSCGTNSSQSAENYKLKILSL